MTDKERAEIFKEMAEFRAANKALYAAAEYLASGADQTMELLKMMFTLNPEKAMEWYREILKNDAQILERGRRLCE